MVKPKCTADFLEVVVREGADELTLRCAASSTPRMWETADEGQPLVDKDWHAVYEGVRGLRGPVLQVRGAARSGQPQETRDQQEGKGAVGTEEPLKKMEEGYGD